MVTTNIGITFRTIVIHVIAARHAVGYPNTGPAPENASERS